MSANPVSQSRPAESVAGLLASLSIFFSLIGVAYRPGAADPRRCCWRSWRSRWAAATSGWPRSRSAWARSASSSAWPSRSSPATRSTSRRSANPGGIPAGTTKTVTVHDVDGLNAGYANALLEQYLENPDGVPDEWRALFESGASELVATHPGLARLVELLQEDGNGHVRPPRRAAASAAAAARARRRRAARRRPTPDTTLLAGRRRRDGARQGVPHARPPRRAPRPARLASRSATRRSTRSASSRS